MLLTRPITRNQPDRGTSGFSLVELLVVMVILSMAAGFVVFNLPETRPSARDEAIKLAARLQLLADSAVERGVLTGLALSDDGYRFVIRRLGGWTTHPGLGSGKPYPWPDAMDISLIIEGSEAELGDNALVEDRTPLIFFTPTGEARPFDLVLSEPFARTETPVYRVRATLTGDISAEPGPPPRPRTGAR